MTLEEAFDTLGLPRGADRDAVRAAFRQAAKAHHPDVQGSDAEHVAAFARAKQAYDVLTGKVAPDKAPQSGANREPRGDEPHGARWQADRRGAERPRRGADSLVHIEVSLEQACRGGRVTVRAAEAAACQACAGAGRIRLTRPVECSTCEGWGGSTQMRGLFRVLVECRDCGGKGKLESRLCEACAGSGGSGLAADVSFDLPPGAADGDVLTLPGKGRRGRNGGPPGDLVITVKLARHPRFRRRGAELFAELRVSFADLCLGGCASFQGIDGARISVLLEPGMACGEIVTFKGHGMPDGRGGRGELHLRILAEVPKRATPEQEALLRRWRETEKSAAR